MPKNYQKAKGSKKGTTTKQFKQLRGGKFQKYTVNVKKCQTFKEATKKDKKVPQQGSQKVKKGIFRPKKSPKIKFKKVLKMAEIAKITFYNDKKKL